MGLGIVGILKDLSNWVLHVSLVIATPSLDLHLNVLPRRILQISIFATQIIANTLETAGTVCYNGLFDIFVQS